MRHIVTSGIEWERGKGYSKRVVLDEGSLGIEGSFFQEVMFKKGDRVPIHHHLVQTEIFYAVTEAFFTINGREIVMQPGDMVVCEPGDMHGNPFIPHDMKILVLKKNYQNDDTYWDE